MCQVTAASPFTRLAVVVMSTLLILELKDVRLNESWCVGRKPIDVSISQSVSTTRCWFRWETSLCAALFDSAGRNSTSPDGLCLLVAPPNPVACCCCVTDQLIGRQLHHHRKQIGQGQKRKGPSITIVVFYCPAMLYTGRLWWHHRRRRRVAATLIWPYWGL